MTIKAKIVARLKANYSGVNLSQKRMDAIADRLATKFTDDSEDADIDAALASANDVFPFADLAKEDDRVRTLEAKAKAAASGGKTPEPDPSKDPAPTPDDTPAWAKALLAKVESLEKGKTVENRQTILSSKLKEAGVSDSLIAKATKDFSRMSIDSQDDFDAFVNETVEDFKEILKTEAEKGLAGIGAPPRSAGQSAKAIDQEIEAWGKSKNPQTN